MALDEKALDAAENAFDNVRLSGGDPVRETIAAYLAAAPGEYAGLVEEARDTARISGIIDRDSTYALCDAIATMSAQLAAAEARVEIVERRNANLNDNLIEARQSLAAAEARAEEAAAYHERRTADAMAETRAALAEHKLMVSERKLAAAEARADGADQALQRISLTLGGTDEWTGQRQMIADVERQVSEALAREAKLREALHELHALVWGECSSLLDEDGGGYWELDLRIRELLEPAPLSQIRNPSK